MSKAVAVVCCLLFCTSCVIVQQDEVGIKRRFGKLSDRTVSSGLHGVNPFTTTMLKVPTRTLNLTVTADLPTKEGLTVNTDIALLYHIKTDKIPVIFTEIGTDFETTFIGPTFRSVVRDVSSRYMAKDLHTAERAAIERAISEELTKFIEPRGFVVEAVLLKSIKLPVSLVTAIEAKLQAEQEAQRMQFVLERERLEAERRKIEAQGTRDAQQILSQGLNPIIIQWHYVQALRELSLSPNAKVIMTDGKTPYLLQSEQQP